MALKIHVTFFSCPFYATKREVMINSVNEVLLKNNLNYPTNFPANELNLYLYGDHAFSPVQHIDSYGYNKIYQKHLSFFTIRFASHFLSLARRSILF